MLASVLFSGSILTGSFGCSGAFPLFMRLVFCAHSSSCWV